MSPRHVILNTAFSSRLWLCSITVVSQVEVFLLLKGRQLWNAYKLTWSYLSYRRDNQELLLFLLKQLVHERCAFERSRVAVTSGTLEAVEGAGGAADEAFTMPTLQVEVSEAEFTEREPQVSILSVRASLTSELFTAHHFSYDAARKVIVHNI